MKRETQNVKGGSWIVGDKEKEADEEEERGTDQSIPRNFTTASVRDCTWSFS